MVCSTACIVADPPEYRDPVQTRPVLDTASASPVTRNVLSAYTNATSGIPFTVPVRSEDAGENLLARFVLDYESTAEETLLSQRIPASTYADTSRSANLPPWIPKASLKDCHIITLIVAHESTFTNGNINQLDKVKAREDAAFMSWWANVDPATDSIQTLNNCPSPVAMP
jgi:hypothetical protein